MHDHVLHYSHSNLKVKLLITILHGISTVKIYIRLMNIEIIPNYCYVFISLPHNFYGVRVIYNA